MVGPWNLKLAVELPGERMSNPEVTNWTVSRQTGQMK